MIKLEDYFMGRDIQYKNELTNSIKNNAIILLDKVNMFLLQIGMNSFKVNSGWRPAAINDATSNAASHSRHLTGEAIDLQDNGNLKDKILANLDKAQSLGLFFEDFRWTPTWCHIQSCPPKSGHRIYVPSSDPIKDGSRWNGHYNKNYDS